MSYALLLSMLRRRRGDARALIDQLRERVRREPPDEPTRRALMAELDRRGVAIEGLDGVWSPGVGEGYVLLAGATGGAVGRLAVRRAGPPHFVGGELGGRALGQALLVFDVLAGRLARLGAGVPHAGRHGHELGVSREVEGSSLGVALAAAVVSRWTDRAPRADVAATAALDAHGRLAPVEGIDAKLRALREAYPAVRRVVVAPEQLVDEAHGFSLVRARVIDEALAAFGLSLEGVEGELLSTTDVEREVALLSTVQVESYAAARWREHALRARVLAAHPQLHAADVTRARAFAALFHLHAGDSMEAAALAGSVGDDDVGELADHARAWVWIIKATSAIDAERLEEARGLAERAVEEASALRGRERRDVWGRALGTLGRARMHAGDDEAALAHLRDAAEHHARELPREAARSFVTLATAFRRGGRHEEALGALDEAARAIERNASERESASSRLFLRYEEARVLYELGRLDEAYAGFERVVLSQAVDEDYPRAGCLRYLAAIDAARGEASRAREWLARALEVEARAPGLIARVAATAAMAVLASDEGLGSLGERAMSAFRARFGAPLSHASVRTALRALVY